MKIHLPKLAALALSIAALILLIVFQKELVEWVIGLEEMGSEAKGMIAFILILLKSITAMVGFPGSILTIASGAFLGTVLGTVVALIGNTIGATLAFLLARYIFKDYVQEKLLKKHPKIRAFEEKLEKGAFKTVLLLRLIPLFPFNALNFILGVTNIKLRDYVIGSLIGMIPGTFLFVYFGEGVGMLNPLNVVLAVVGIIGLTLLGRYYSKKY